MEYETGDMDDPQMLNPPLGDEVCCSTFILRTCRCLQFRIKTDNLADESALGLYGFALCSLKATKRFRGPPIRSVARLALLGMQQGVRLTMNCCLPSVASSMSQELAVLRQRCTSNM